MRFLLAGVPQLIARWHVETYMMARQIEKRGVGMAFPEVLTERSVNELIRRLAIDAELSGGLNTFVADAAQLCVREAVSRLTISCRDLLTANSVVGRERDRNRYAYRGTTDSPPNETPRIKAAALRDCRQSLLLRRIDSLATAEQHMYMFPQRRPST